MAPSLADLVYWLNIPARKGGVGGHASWAPDGETTASSSGLPLFIPASLPMGILLGKNRLGRQGRRLPGTPNSSSEPFIQCFCLRPPLSPHRTRSRMNSHWLSRISTGGDRMGPKGISKHLYTPGEGQDGLQLQIAGIWGPGVLRWDLCVHLGLEGPSLDRQPDMVICYGQNEECLVCRALGQP